MYRSAAGAVIGGKSADAIARYLLRLARGERMKHRAFAEQDAKRILRKVICVAVRVDDVFDAAEIYPVAFRGQKNVRARIDKEFSVDESRREVSVAGEAFRNGLPIRRAGSQKP